MAMRDPVTEFYSKAMGINLKQDEADVLSERLAKTVDKIGKIAEANGYATVLQKMVGQEGQHQSTVSAAAEQITLAKELAGIEDMKASRYREEAELARQQLQELREEVRGMHANKSDNNMNMLTLLMQMQQQAQERADRMQERYERMISDMRTQHQEELRRMEERARNGEKKEKTVFEQIMEQKMIEDLTSPAPSALQQIGHWKGVLTDLGLVGDNSKSDDTAASLRLKELELQHKHEMMKYDKELAMQERKIENQKNMIEQFSGIAAAIITGRQGQPVQPGQSAAPAEGSVYRYVCQNCGTQKLGNKLIPSAECPECHGEMKPASTGGDEGA